ncbi:MAG: DsbA family oxidoreductase [Alphaproteobacteria bacterium]
MLKKTIHIDIFSDPICPWCFIGNRRLARALAARPDIEASILWRPFQLNPNMPELGMERARYLAEKFGDPHRIQRLYADLTKAGETVGIHFAFDKIKSTPNTLPAHLLIRLAQKNLKTKTDYQRRDRLIEALFVGYFVEGRDIGAHSELIKIGYDAGLSKQQIAEYLDNGYDVQEVLTEDLHARHIGVSGIPYFILNGRLALMGAQEPEAFDPLFDALILESSLST